LVLTLISANAVRTYFEVYLFSSRVFWLLHQWFLLPEGSLSTFWSTAQVVRVRSNSSSHVLCSTA